MNMSLAWYGDSVVAKMQKAARLGINKTMAQCVLVVKDTHEQFAWKNVTGTAERSIRIWKAAVTNGVRTFGIWGSVGVDYFKHLEFGTMLRRAYPVLRPVASMLYPNLNRCIKEEYAKL